MTANGAAGICDTSGKDLALMIRRRALSVREVVTAFLARIDKFNPAANAIVSLRPRADILAEADAADQTAAAERETKALFGLPIAIKDLAMTKGVTTTYGSPIFARFVPVEDDLHVARASGRPERSSSARPTHPNLGLAHKPTTLSSARPAMPTTLP